MQVEAIWVGNGNIPYEKEKHLRQLYNFIFWEAAQGRALLIAGSGSWPDASHKNLYQRYLDNGGEKPGRYPDGAGNRFGKNEYTWSSTGFCLKTPEKYRQAIISALE